MQPSSWSTDGKLESLSKMPHFSSCAGSRKRKVDVTDLDEQSQHKMFLTEEKLIDNMRTLSLHLPVNRQTPSDDQPKKTNENEAADVSYTPETHYELHTLFKDTLKNDDLQDQFINKLCELERFAMQIVPYMPIHPAQLDSNQNNVQVKSEEQKNDQATSASVQTSEVKKDKDDHLFKRPFSPVPYTVEEPIENSAKRTPRMKRSYSQSVRYNSNLTVVELKNDARDSSVQNFQSDYYILEPSTPALTESPTGRSSSFMPMNKSSVHISEYFDFTSPELLVDNDDVDMHSSLSFDACDQMDDDI